MKHAQCVKKGQRLVTLCKNKWCDESSHIIRHLHLSSTEHEDSDPAEQFTQDSSAAYTGPQCRHLQRSSRQAGTETVGSITLLALSAASCYTQRQWLNYLGPSSQSMGHIFLCSAGIVGVVAGSLAWFPCPLSHQICSPADFGKTVCSCEEQPVLMHLLELETKSRMLP